MKETLEFGLNAAIPDGTPYAWGARAIDDNIRQSKGRFDIPPDRKSWFGDLQKVKEMCKWLDNGAMERCAKEVSREAPHDSIRLIDRRDGYIAMARRYGGYVYLAVYPEPAQTSEVSS